MAEKKGLGNPKWVKGKSANPSGRPVGIEDKRVKYRKMLGNFSTELVSLCVTQALAGDNAMLKLCIDKLLPNARSERIVSGVIKNLSKNDIESLQAASKSIVTAVSKDDITPDQAKSCMTVLEGHAKMIDRTEIIDRLDRIESKLK